MSTLIGVLLMQPSVIETEPSGLGTRVRCRRGSHTTIGTNAIDTDRADGTVGDICINGRCARANGLAHLSVRCGATLTLV
mmetsp:Transcript_16567/g.38958  ORF Transcript_16567/g.38958 Transcript_16567/m.38958 type:complete len:80 (-) Transcript_16567:686-925(-)